MTRAHLPQVFRSSPPKPSSSSCQGPPFIWSELLLLRTLTRRIEEAAPSRLGSQPSCPFVRFLSHALLLAYARTVALPSIDNDRVQSSASLGASGDKRWPSQQNLALSARSGDGSCAKWCLSPTAQFTKWSSEESFRGASPSRPAALSGIWRRSKRGWLRADQLQLSARSPLTSGSGDRALFESRVGFKQRHRRRDEYRDAFLARDPGVDDIRPFLHHMATLHLVLCLVVDSA